MAHTGDKVPHDAWDERFEHPARTWASASHRAFTLQATGVAMVNATYMFMRDNSRFEMMRAVSLQKWIIYICLRREVSKNETLRAPTGV